MEPEAGTEIPPVWRMGASRASRLSRAGECRVKTFVGHAARERFDCEQTCLVALAGLLPVPTVRSSDPVALGLSLESVEGRPGPEVLTPGTSTALCFELGRFLRRLHDTDRGVLPAGFRGTGRCLVHGDFGPHRLLFAEQDFSIRLVMDWDWAHYGNPLEDLGWVEWIIRYLYPECTHGIDEVFRGYGRTPTWPERHCAMMKKCQTLLDFADKNGDREGAAWWEHCWAETMHFTER